MLPAVPPAAVPLLPSCASSCAMPGASVNEDGLIPNAPSRIEVVGSVVLEELSEVAGEKRSSIHCTVCAAAASAFTTAVEGVAFKSLCPVAKADGAVDRSPDESAVPSVVRSVASCDVPEDEDDEEDEPLVL